MITASSDRLSTPAPLERPGTEPARRHPWMIPAALALAVVVGAAVFLGPPLRERMRSNPAPAGGSVDAMTGTPRELVQRARELLGRYDKAGNIDRAIALLEMASTVEPGSQSAEEGSAE